VSPAQQSTAHAEATGADGEDALVSSAHVVQFYEDDAFLVEVVSRFIDEGILAGEPVLVLATGAHCAAVRQALEAKGVDAGGRVALVDTAEVLDCILIDGAVDTARFRATMSEQVGRLGANGARVRIFGELVDVLCRQGHPEAGPLIEAIGTELCSTGAFTLVCAYALGSFREESDGARFGQVCAAHARALPSERWTGNGTEDERLREITRLQQRALALETELRRREELEDALRRAREDAEAASRAKDEFLAMLGHELRNPLAPMVTALQLMKLRGDGRTSKEQEILERQTRHLIRLVDDLLDVARITRGKVELRRHAIDLRDVIAKATEVASPLLEQRRHHFEVRAPRQPMRVLADEARLSQVIANLLTNAARYTEPGGHISVTARRDGSAFVIEVRDDGVGIEADLLSRIFEPFVQGPQAADRANGGLGIGLSLVKNLIELHGGTVEARSPGPGAGSTFVVVLPVLEREPSPQPLPVVEPLRAGPAPRRRVLLVDDNADTLETLRELLRDAGHDVRTAGDGPTALALLQGFKPDVAILDLGLPAMDGYELALRLRTLLGPGAPMLLALSGYGQQADRERSRAAGFHRHIVKPFDPVALLDEIAGLVR
jgi:signal transduction histidine kinase